MSSLIRVIGYTEKNGIKYFNIHIPCCVHGFNEAFPNLSLDDCEEHKQEYHSSPSYGLFFDAKTSKL